MQRRIMGRDRLEWRTAKRQRTLSLCRLVPDPTGLWRVECDGRLSDIVNISRASDAALSLALGKLNRMEERAAEARPCVSEARAIQ